jgi:hypothetical protein
VAGLCSKAGLLDLKILTDGFLTHGRWHAHGVILFESTTPLGTFAEFRSGVIIYESKRYPAAGFGAFLPAFSPALLARLAGAVERQF